jgi:hypothetical protein
MELIHPSQELVILYSSTASTWLTTTFARSIKKFSPDWLTSLLFIWLANRWESYKLAITTVIWPSRTCGWKQYSYYQRQQSFAWLHNLPCGTSLPLVSSSLNTLSFTPMSSSWISIKTISANWASGNYFQFPLANFHAIGASFNQLVELTNYSHQI